MYFKKFITATVTAALLSVCFVMPVSAHGHHRQATVNTECPVCTFEDCTEKGRHTHDGQDYCGYEHVGDYCDGTCATVSRRASRRRHCCH